MPDEIDLREQTEQTDRCRVFEALDNTDEGGTRTVRATGDVEHLLYRYQIIREHALDWTSEQDGPDGWEFAVTKGASVAEGMDIEFDVRDLPPQQRHSVLLATFDNLAPGQRFVLVNDHDPKPLSYELRSTRGDVFEWEYRSRDAGQWEVAITKTDSTETTDGEALTTFDVREIPKQERHPAIHHRYGMIPAGETVAIVAPHEPEPLHREFQQRYGDGFTWEVTDHEPGECRVHIRKLAASDAGSETVTSADDTESVSCHHHGAETPDHDDAGTDDHGDDPTGQHDADETKALSVTDELDVRDLPPAQRHEQIFDAYAGLQDGQGFVLVNDHDPKPLYHQFDAEEGPEFYWEYQQREPGEFRVLIGKHETAVASPDTEPPL